MARTPFCAILWRSPSKTMIIGNSISNSFATKSMSAQDREVHCSHMVQENPWDTGWTSLEQQAPWFWSHCWPHSCITWKSEENKEHPKTQHHPKTRVPGRSRNLRLRVCCVFGCSLFPSKRAPKHTRKRNTPEIADSGNDQVLAFSGVFAFLGVFWRLPRKGWVFLITAWSFYLRLVFVAYGKLVWSFLLVEVWFGLFAYGGKSVWSFLLTVHPVRTLGFVFFCLPFPLRK